jgi:hypothetical protein
VLPGVFGLNLMIHGEPREGQCQPQPLLVLYSDVAFQVISGMP